MFTETRFFLHRFRRDLTAFSTVQSHDPTLTSKRARRWPLWFALGLFAICQLPPQLAQAQQAKATSRPSRHHSHLSKKPRAKKPKSPNKKNVYVCVMKEKVRKLDLSKIRKIGKRRYQITRDFLEGVMSQPDILGSRASIVPFFEKGQAVGFRIYRIQKGSFHEKIGLKNNDIIRRINGYNFTTPHRALVAYSSLMTSSLLNISVQRSGRMISIYIEIKK